MTYPDEWASGATTGRNLVSHPKFVTGSAATDYGAWRDSGDVAERGGAFFGARITFASQPKIELADLTIAEHAGQTLTITVNITSIDEAIPAVFITAPGGAWSIVAGAAMTELPFNADGTYGWHTADIVLPEGPFKDTRGDTLESPAVYDLSLGTVANGILLGNATIAISGIRVDFANSPVADANGYLDGDTTGLTGHAAAWDAPPANGTFAPTTALATADSPGYGGTTVTIDPVPVQSWTAGEPVSLVLSGSTTHTDPALSWTLEAGTLPAGVTLDAAGTIAGTPEAEGTGTATIGAADLNGSSATVPLEWSVAAADTGGDNGGNMDDLADTLAPLIAAFVGKPGKAATTEQARASVPIVAEFVRAYTRGNGWTGDAPDGPIRAVIVSATARLVMNPAQVASYQMADYSERPAVLNGYTIAEQGVLHNYRRRQA